MSDLQDRLNDFKSTATADDVRRRRQEQSQRLRQSRRDEVMAKRRQVAAPPGEHSDVFATSGPVLAQAPPPEGAVLADPSMFRALADEMRNGDAAAKLRATYMIRRALSKQKNPPIDEVLGVHILPTLVSFLTYDNEVRLQFEASWALTNIASGTSQQTEAVVKANAIPHFVRHLSSPSIDVREQAVWALGNIAGDNVRYRDEVLRHGAMDPLLKILADQPASSLTRNATWTLSNFCRGKPLPDEQYRKKALPALSRLIMVSDDNIVYDACWALSYLSEEGPVYVSEVINAGACPQLVALLRHQSTRVVTPTIRAVGNIVTGTDLQTQLIVNLGALPMLRDLMLSTMPTIRKEACWTISNIMAGNEMQVKAAIQVGCIPVLVDRLKLDRIDVAREAAWAINNCAANCMPERIATLVQANVLEAIDSKLENTDEMLVAVLLGALQRILLVGSQRMEMGHLPENPYAATLNELGSVRSIEALQRSSYSRVSSLATDIISRHFSGARTDALHGGAIDDVFGTF